MFGVYSLFSSFLGGSRDVLTCASPLPFAVRLRCSLPGTCLRLKFLDAATGETLRELRGKHVLQASAETTTSKGPEFHLPFDLTNANAQFRQNHCRTLDFRHR